MRLLALLGLLLIPNLFVAQSAHGDYFYRWPTEKQVAASSVIARAEWKLAGGVLKCIIAEIIKEEPGTYFPFKVGDEFPRGNQRARANTDYGDGTVIFLTGSRASLRFISGFSGGRLLGAGNIPLEKVRDIVKKERANPKPSPEVEKPHYDRYLEVATSDLTNRFS